MGGIWNITWLGELNFFQMAVLSKFRYRSNFLPVSQIKLYQNEDDWEDCLICLFCMDDLIGY